MSAPSQASAHDQAVNGSAAAGPVDEGTTIAFKCKYAQTVHSVRLTTLDEVSDLKAILFSLTDVPAERQKLIGLTKGKLPSDDTLIGQLAFPPSSVKGKTAEGLKEVSMILVGTPKALTFKDIGKADEALEDLIQGEAADLDPKAVDEQLLPHRNPKYIAKVEMIIKRFSDFPLITPPRPGKKLLVLDLDYTLVDTDRLLHSPGPAMESARPGMHDFLATVYPYYDLVCWSQTSWRWVDAKLTELHMLSDPRYKLSWVLDKTTMPSVETKGKKHHVKPLELIWRRFGPEQYSPKNTLHIDDLSKNFAMNPGNGLKIKPYKNSPHMDSELVAIGKYCLQLAHPSVEDFTKIDHRSWKHFNGPTAE
ncbi:HAD-superfamily subfamily IIID h protein [Tilletiaria anomala UBC 951]|uniref:HAD-superfamily subfamily IIID h protein n=1 Tax=Tilletiaria anomala (strain ATCC 24038 / CBS 436.72 / UBC 951) TaxID=1037660 RepID=A0A066VWU1_TILAU|nr:HAD-superfamily subfamily IIID h protein [Tilletiaria anomala UBC 951]KDN45936.1 HAD-superfamily subfamily IIID h protein [Tilletiaria anomala UBC 951]